MLEHITRNAFDRSLLPELALKPFHFGFRCLKTTGGKLGRFGPALAEVRMALVVRYELDAIQVVHKPYLLAVDSPSGPPRVIEIVFPLLPDNHVRATPPDDYRPQAGEIDTGAFWLDISAFEAPATARPTVYGLKCGVYEVQVPPEDQISPLPPRS